MKIERPNQVWATDLTYIPMARGFCYLVAVIDWFTRKVLAWRLSITMDAAFCIEANLAPSRRAPRDYALTSHWKTRYNGRRGSKLREGTGRRQANLSNDQTGGTDVE